MPHRGDGTDATLGKASNGRSRAPLLPRPRWQHTEVPVLLGLVDASRRP